MHYVNECPHKYSSTKIRVCVCVCVCASEGNIDETIQCLEKLADVSRSNGLQHNLAEAYLCLGNIYYKRV